ncbi:MAG: uL15 family ribosomal protein [Candidatus Thermoplasmatota archaeon]
MSRKKTKKYRGSKTHGRGSMKKGRGAGEKGGRGKAGWGKHKFMHMRKVDPGHFGKKGFKRPPSTIKKDETINVGELEDKFPEKKEIDLTKEGYDKLLGSGTIDKKIKVKVEKTSKKAVEKIEAKDGKIIKNEQK